ncbi:MAG: hypothetical protein R2745_12615 [Vicinamibacterales bacterium]
MTRASAGQAPAPCRAEADRQRLAWGAVAPPRMQPTTTDGTIVEHWPTRALGAWIVDARGPRTTVLTRVTAGAITRVEWSAACATVETRRDRTPVPGPRFTDRDLAERLSAGDAGVIYVWAPHMPLSIDAAGALREAAARRRLPVEIVLHPDADRAFAARVADEHGWDAAALRVADSVELTFRDVFVHAPAAQAWANGRLVGSAYPGGHTADEYGRYLDRVLP